MLLRPVKGDSMMPLLDERTDIVKLIPTSDILKPYELPLYRRPNGALVLHRIIKVKKKHYVICGDNRQFYERVPHEWVIALAIGRYRGGDYLDFQDADHISRVKQFCAKRDGLLGRCRAAIAKVKRYGTAAFKRLFR